MVGWTLDVTKDNSLILDLETKKCGDVRPQNQQTRRILLMDKVKIKTFQNYFIYV